MKLRLPISFTFVLIFSYPFVSTAQSVFNAGFEQWEQINGIWIPENWSTSNNPEIESYPVSVHREENACVGMYSIKITSTAPSLEGPGPGFAKQYIELQQPSTSASITFTYAADTLFDGAVGIINLSGYDYSGTTPIIAAFQSLEINELTNSCTNATLTINSATPFDELLIELRAEPYYTPFNTVGLSVIRVDDIQLDLSVSVNDFDISGQLTIIPNPTKGPLYLHHNNQRIIDIQVFDLSGKLLQQVHMIDQYIDLSSLPKGTYLLKALTDQGTAVKKVVKE